MQGRSSYGVSQGRGGRGRGGRGRGGRGWVGGRGAGPPPVCTFYLQGRCNRGTDCRFRHDDGVVTSPSDGARAVDTRQSSSKREFDPNKAEAISRAKRAQDAEERPWSSLDGPFYSIDVECVASGYGHGSCQRIPGRVALVDGEGNTVIDEVIRHDDDEVGGIVSYLTPLTGLTREGCEAATNKTIDEVTALIQSKLPKDAILVGQSIDHDIEWLGLEKGTDYKDSVDLALIFRQRIPKVLISASNAVKREKGREEKEGGEGNGEAGSNEISSSSAKPSDAPDDTGVGFPTRYRIFGLRHCCVHLLSVDMQSAHHDPVDDSRYSILLFNKYKSASSPLLRAVRDSLHRAPITPSFSADNPVIDGVCMSRAGYALKHAARFIWRWWAKYSGRNCTSLSGPT